MNPVQDTFMIKIVDVKTGMAVVSVHGSLWEVASQAPLVPGQVFLVSQEQREGMTTWRLLKELPDSTPGTASRSILSKYGLSEDPENAAIISALSKAGLPGSAEYITHVRRLLNEAGGFTLANLMAAVTAAKLGLPTGPLLQALLTYLGSLLLVREKDSPTPDAELPETGEFSDSRLLGRNIKKVTDTFRELLLLLSGRLAKAQGSAPQQTLLGEVSKLQEQLLGGQLFAWVQESAGETEPFYYIPIFTLLPQKMFAKGEIYVYPESFNKKKAPGRCLLLNLETHYLGWVQVEFILIQPFPQIGVVVENQAAKEMIDRNWPQLAASLDELNLHFTWSGCKVGAVRTPIRFFGTEQQTDGINPALDLTV